MRGNVEAIIIFKLFTTNWDLRRRQIEMTTLSINTKLN